MSNESPKKGNIFGLFVSLAETLLIVALLVIAVISFGTRVPALARIGFNFFAVTSGSMQPKIPTGSLIYAGKYKLEDLKQGDVITYQKTNPDSKQSSVVTHRIFSIDKKEEKQQTNDNGKKSEKITITYTFKTKGDANSKPDEYTVIPGEIIGLYKWHLPVLGYVSIFAQQPLGFMLLVILPATILIVWEIASVVLHFKQHYEKKSQSEIERLKAELAKKDLEHA